MAKCLDSVLMQGFGDFELILVDDESTDGSVAICADYATQDSRIRLICQKNGGAAKARNAGLDVARGEYILFIDSDDFLTDNSLGKIMQYAAGQDIIFFDARHLAADGRLLPHYTKYDRANFFQKSQKQVLDHLAKNDPLPVLVWDKLIRRQFLVDNDIKFTENIIVEDVDFCLQLYTHAKAYDCAPVDAYRYRINRPGSVMGGNIENKFTSLIFIIQKWTSLAESRFIAYRPEILQILAYQFCMLLPMYGVLSKKLRKAKRGQMRDAGRVLGHNSDLRVRLVWLIFRLFGACAAAGVLGFYHKIKSLGGRLDGRD